MKIDLLHNQDNESPTSFAQRLGAQYMSTISNEAKKEKGQFFTPIEIARFMSNIRAGLWHLCVVLCFNREIGATAYRA